MPAPRFDLNQTCGTAANFLRTECAVADLPSALRSVIVDLGIAALPTRLHCNIMT
jgi:hypothetical protein